MSVKILLDTDIGSDIDDALCLAYLLANPNCELLGITTQELMNMNEITGGSPYGASTLAAMDGSRQPSQNEIKIARFQGSHVAEIAKKQSGG